MTSGDIWQQFGIATWHAQRTGWLLRAVLYGCLCLTIVPMLLWWSGSTSPHIRWNIVDFFLRADVDENGVLSTRVYIDVENEGLVPFTLTGISMEMPGLRLLPADKAEDEPAEVSVKGSGMETMRRRIVITDCAAVPHEPQPVRITYRTWMGPGSAEVTWKSWQMTGKTSGRAIPVAWQRALATKVCSDAVNPEWP